MKKAIAIAVVLAGMSVAGYAQEVTLSDLQAKGAKTLAKDELETVVKGATIHWTTTKGVNFQIKFAEDGSIAGSYINPSRTMKGVPLSGTWKIADDGKLCRAQVQKGQTDEICWVVSKLGDKYYQGIKTATELQITK